MYFWYFTIGELVVHFRHQHETPLFNNTNHERLPDLSARSLRVNQ